MPPLFPSTTLRAELGLGAFSARTEQYATNTEGCSTRDVAPWLTPSKYKASASYWREGQALCAGFVGDLEDAPTDVGPARDRLASRDK